ncbi:MAG: hypothetical protein Q7T73_08000 [Beijerinckiaceae bacterium]|nr:hypothetical protein [Beijerinckiaceae bacterium]
MKNIFAQGFAAALTLGLAACVLPGAAVAQGATTLEARKSVYAPWSPDQMPERRKQQGLIGPGPQVPVTAPAFPSYLKKPNSTEELMPQARAAVRQSGGRTPLGLVLPGKTLLIVVGEAREPRPNMMVQEAISRALAERGAKAIVLTTWDLLGVSEEDYVKVRAALREFTISDGQRELEYFFTTTGLMRKPEEGRAWIQKNDPDLYAATWPKLKLEDPELAKLAARYQTAIPKALVAWLDKNPGVDWIVWRSGGRGNTRRLLDHHADKYLGSYTYFDLYDLMSQVPAFPSDVWRQVETKTIESISFVDRVEVTDPEGTAFGYNVAPDEAKAWSEGVYQQGHLYMFPAQGTGRFPYSKIEYPKLAGTYIKPVQPEVTGIIASTTSHAASHPRIEIEVSKGRISDIRGGGLYGEGMRLLQNYPGTKDLTWPMAGKPGYWWLYEAGMGTNPKYFKHPAEVLEGINLSERNVAGVVHWAFGTEVAMGPDKPGDWDAKTVAFSEQHALPMGHSMHNHNTLPTFQVRIRELDQWVTLVEHGGLKALDDVGVRALASRYGNPQQILSRDYVTALPGINAPGSYDEYARHPGAYWTRWAQSIEAGNYPFFKP